MQMVIRLYFLRERFCAQNAPSRGVLIGPSVSVVETTSKTKKIYCTMYIHVPFAITDSPLKTSRPGVFYAQTTYFSGC